MLGIPLYLLLPDYRQAVGAIDQQSQVMQSAQVRLVILIVAHCNVSKSTTSSTDLFTY